MPRAKRHVVGMEWHGVVRWLRGAGGVQSTSVSTAFATAAVTSAVASAIAAAALSIIP